MIALGTHEGIVLILVFLKNQKKKIEEIMFVECHIDNSDLFNVWRKIFTTIGKSLPCTIASSLLYHRGWLKSCATLGKACREKMRRDKLNVEFVEELLAYIDKFVGGGALAALPGGMVGIVLATGGNSSNEAIPRGKWSNAQINQPSLFAGTDGQSNHSTCSFFLLGLTRGKSII
ncbi:hypothetical protein Syun_029417 [Stephania yunnanensis]|uniref:Uncharacterized protein n=1 Tax=Stephania yunnanensis TaxID=152371 RepID=A0AAP0ED61_9MAGN